jgi:hypothetical protein
LAAAVATTTVVNALQVLPGKEHGEPKGGNRDCGCGYKNETQRASRL